MGFRKKLDKASMGGLPSWMVEETISKEGAKIQKDWTRISRNAKPGDRGMQRLSAGMQQLRSARPVHPLLGRANARALRWAEEKVKRCELARQLCSATPTVSLAHRLVLLFNSTVMRTSGLALLIMIKIGVFHLIDAGTKVFDRISRLHIDRHIGPMS